MRGRAVGTWLVWVLVAAKGVTVAAAADVGHIYDDLGRLIAVIDPASDTAVYAYDAVGNLLAITRHASSAVAVIEFRPRRGPVGTAVTLEGTGFGATPGSNTVTFNGVAAPVTAASATRLVVTVPAGASTGAIAVTAPAGTASSASPFTVTATDGAPTLTGFTPALGTPGTAVTLTGTAFEPIATHNTVAFYGVPRVTATVDSATPTSLGVTVPVGARSGPVRVATPNGAVTSAADFFVPPGSYTATSVVFTGRMVIGGASVAVALPSSGTVGLVLFDGAAGQRLDLGTVGAPSTVVTVYRPDGAVLPTTGSPSARYFAPLPLAGTYTLAVTASAAATITLTLSEEVAGTVTVGGASVAVSVPRAGQRARVTFAGAAGQRLGAGVTAITWTGGATLRVLTAEDGVLATGAAGSSGAVDSPPLPASGPHAVAVEPSAAATGSFTLTLSEEVAGVIVVDGASVPVAVTRPGQQARLTFAGTSGQRLSLGLTAGSLFGSVAVARPDGTALVAPVGYGVPAGALDLPVLPAPGTYELVLEPGGTNTGSVTLTLSQEVSGTLTVGGAAVPVSIARPGQRARLTYAGTAGQRVSVGVSGTTVTGALTVFRPDGAVLQSAFLPGPALIEPATLPATGTYTVLVDPSAANTGGTTLTLYDVPPDVTGSLEVNGPAAPVTTTVPGQNAALTFAGTSGQGITIAGSGSTYGCVVVTLLRPSGSNPVWQPCTASFALPTTVTSTGTHTVKIDPVSASTGSVTVGVSSP